MVRLHAEGGKQDSREAFGRGETGETRLEATEDCLGKNCPRSVILSYS